MIMRLLPAAVLTAWWLTVVVDWAQAYDCPVDGERVPSGIVLDPASKFDFLEAGLTICPSYSIPCDGFIKQWQFIAVNPFVIGLHLGVFRRDAYSKVYHLVGSSYLNALRTPQGIRNAWIYQPVDPPLSVNKGDVIGFFYDEFKTRNELLTIGSRRRQFFKGITNSTALSQPCLVLVADSTALINRERAIDMTMAAEDDRIPALIAIVAGTQSVESEDYLSGSELNAPIPRQYNFTEIATPSPAASIRMQPDSSFEEQTTGPTQHFFTIKQSNDASNNQLADPVGVYQGSEAPSATPATPKYRRHRTTTPTTIDTTAPPAVTTTIAPVFAYIPDPQQNNQGFDYEIIPQPNLPVKTVVELCLKTPTALQVCGQATMRAFFDYRYGICQPFFGCPPLYEGSENNFASIQICKLTCMEE